MKVKEITSWLENEIPLAFQESWDNSGLQAGNPESETNSALISLDVTEDVVDEAVAKKCNLIISHHPLIFDKLRKITPGNSTGRIIIKAIKNDISIYSVHTNLDIINGGVSFKMASLIGLKNLSVLSPLKNRLLKLVTYVPENHIEKVRQAIFDAGAGRIGNYDNCSFGSAGKGTFRAGELTHPFVGKKGSLHSENEIRLETVFIDFQKEAVIDALLKSHPYEEPAYDIYKIENLYNISGTGCSGEFENAMDEKDFLRHLSDTFGLKSVRFSPLTGKKIKKVSVCGGAGIFLLNDAINSGSQAFVTGDIKYHDYFNAINQILLADVGHFESEKFSREILYDLIIKKFPKFAVRFSEINTNPVNYL